MRLTVCAYYNDYNNRNNESKKKKVNKERKEGSEGARALQPRPRVLPLLQYTLTTATPVKSQVGRSANDEFFFFLQFKIL